MSAQLIPIILLLVVIAVSLSHSIAQTCSIQKFSNGSATGTSSLDISSDMWPLNGYCGLQRTDEEILEDDEEIYKFYAGLTEPSNWTQLVDSFNQLNEAPILARETLPVFCATTAWGYNDNRTSRLADGSRSSGALCSRELDRLIELSQNMSILYMGAESLPESDFDYTRWLQLNSFGRPTSGPPYKSHLWLGDYEACKRVGERLLEEIDETGGGTRYCFGSFGRENQGEHGTVMRSFRLGLCLPETCPSSDGLTSSLDEDYIKKLDLIVKMNFRNDYYFLTTAGSDTKRNLSGPAESFQEFNYENGNYKLLSLYCLPNDHSELRRLLPNLTSENYGTFVINSFLLLVLPVAWFSALIYSTQSSSLSTRSPNVIRQQKQQGTSVLLFSSTSGHQDKSCDDNLKTDESERGVLQGELKTRAKPLVASHDSLHSIIRCFDLRENSVSFFNANAQSGQLASLNAIKVLAMNWLLLTHIYLLQMSYSKDLQSYRDRASLLGALLLNGQHLVPIFFIISGLLFQHKSITIRLKGLEDNRRNFLYKYIETISLRYLRLMPMYLICYAYIKQFAHLLGSGPLWDYGESNHSDQFQCRKESWLVPIFVLANFNPPFFHCIITSWHIANDVQIVLILPLISYAYNKSRLSGRIITISAFVFTHLTHALNWGASENYTMFNMIMEPFIFGPRYIIDRQSYDYVNPLGRVGTYFLGVLLAELLFDSPRDNRREEELRGGIGETVEKTSTKDGAQMNLECFNVSGSKTMKIEKFKHKIEAKTAGNSNFKVNSLFTLAVLLVCLAMFIILLPREFRALLTPIPKQIAYPSVRLGVEVAWAALLYCLISLKKRENNVIEIGVNSESSSGACPTRESNSLYGLLTHCLSFPIWSVLIKLNYCIMLTHFTLAKWLIQTQLQLIQFTWIQYMQFATLYLCLLYASNLALHLLIEMPLNRMVELLKARLFSRRNIRELRGESKRQ